MPQSRFKEFAFKGDENTYIVPSWKQMGEVNFDLIKLVVESGKEYDRVVALGKGGWTWARAFVDGLGMDALSGLRIQLYKGINQKEKKPKILERLTSNVRNKRVLLFDDVVDSGETYEFAKNHILEKHGAAQVDTAALFWKPDTSVIVPDYSPEQTSAWIVFPHEIHEFIKETGPKWLFGGLSKRQLISRYTSMGIPRKDVIFYVNRLQQAA